MIWEQGWLGFTYDYLCDCLRSGASWQGVERAILSRLPLMRAN